MSQRERLAAGTVSEPAPRPTGGHPAAPRPHLPPETNVPPLQWEDYFRKASPARQRELLLQAEQHGVVYAHQLPPHANGTADPTRHLFAQLIAGRLDELETFPWEAVAWIDQALDDEQREAVAKALATPDLCLIQGLPGTGKTRVVQELAAQAIEQGLRVLLLSPLTATLDRVLEQIGARDNVAPIRCLARDEQPDLLPSSVQALTYSARLRCLQEQAGPVARRQLEEAVQRCQARERDQPVLENMLQLAQRDGELSSQQTQLTNERERVPAEVELQAQAGEAENSRADGAPFSASMAQALAARQQARDQHDKALAELRQRNAAIQKDLKEVQDQLTALVPFAEAKQQGRWWSWTWWQAAGQGNVVAKASELETRKKQLDKDLVGTAEEERRLEDEQALAQKAFLAERNACCQAEIDRRQQELAGRLQALHIDREQLAEQWRERASSLDAGTPHPQDRSAAAVQTALTACCQQLLQEKQQADFARNWTATLIQQAPNFGPQLVSQANLVAATTQSLAADPQFGDQTGLTFDLLILDDAQLIAEADWLPLARRARRWVLVGDSVWERKEPATTEQDRDSNAPRRDLARPNRSMSFSRTVPRLLPRLWRQLHVDPRHLPYAWFQEEGRWCCRLRELTPEQRRQLENECVADRPEIELRILAQPRLAPILAEVAFPASMTIPQAKEYIYRELQELPVQAHGTRIRWSEEAGKLVFHLSDSEPATTLPITLEAGVRELLLLPASVANGHGVPAAPSRTHCLEFDSSVGWNRARAEDWVHVHLGIRDLGRTVQLHVPHRLHPHLATLASRLVFDDGYRLHCRVPRPEHLVGNDVGPAFEFVSVASEVDPVARLGEVTRGKQENGRRGSVAVRPRPSRGGAGLEADLTDPRSRERLPVELRGGLPAQGFANCAEAHAVVRALEQLAQHPASAGWRIGVSALYPGQVQLIRNVIHQSAALKEAPFALRIEEPGGFRGRECQIMLLSLTRSHSHRAVTFGDGPQLFGLALTRARAKLIVFGDIGTLQRRCQWDGPVDQLDAEGAQRERELLSRLLQAIPGDDAPLPVASPREGHCS